MKKLLSLIKACMTSDMNIFKINIKKKSKFTTYIPIFIALYLMFVIWMNANMLFEKVAPLNLCHVLLALFIFSISLMTFMEGIYKTGSLIFNCKDDDLLLSLPIKRRTILFIRVFKFYVFELLFNSIFLLPILISYIRWDPSIEWTYYLTSIIMLILLPIIPIVLSLVVGVITSSLSSRFKYKNALQIILSMALILGILFVSYNSEGLLNYIIKNSTSINDLITKIYYPAGLFTKLVTDFKVIDLLIFILSHVLIFSLTIIILSKFYFKINTRLKSVITSNNKKVNINNMVIKANSQTKSIVRKEINTFFKTPVFIINAGFALVLFILATIIICVKFDSVIPILISKENGLGLSKELIYNNLSIIILLLLSITSFMTSITSSVISLEGKNINILKSLPVRPKIILMGKILAALVITTPVLLIGNLILFIKFKINIIESILLLALSIIIPLVSHFIGIIVNLKYPKLDFENSTEVVKQSMSSFISVMIGMILLILSCAFIIGVMGKISSILILILTTLLFIIIDILLYIYISTKGERAFNNLMTS